MAEPSTMSGRLLPAYPNSETVMKNAEVGVGFFVLFCFFGWGFFFFFSVILTVIYIFGAIKLAV